MTTVNTERVTYFDEMKVLFQLLDLNYNALLKQHTQAQIMTPECQLLRSADSTFAMCLKQFPWLPAVQGQCVGDAGEIKQKRSSRVATSIYVRSPHIEEVFSHHVAYLDCPVIESSSFSNWLGLKKVVTVENVKDMLLTWCAPTIDDDDADADAAGDVEFVTSLRHMKNVYTKLQQHLPPKDFQDLFQDHSAIFYAPRSGGLADDSNAIGRFLNRKQVWWRDNSALFNKYKSQVLSADLKRVSKPDLCVLYGQDFQDMFVRQARVAAGPDLGEYAVLLREIVQSVTAVSTVLEDVLQVCTEFL